jgi:hypothetical protein
MDLRHLGDASFALLRPQPVRIDCADAGRQHAAVDGRLQKRFPGALRAGDWDAAICISVFVTTLIFIVSVIHMFGLMRVSEESELQGLDLGTASRPTPSTSCTARLHPRAPRHSPSTRTQRGIWSWARNSRSAAWPRATAGRSARPDHHAGGATCFRAPSAIDSATRGSQLDRDAMPSRDGQRHWGCTMRSPCPLERRCVPYAHVPT